jgi:hypothetical protein
MDYLFELLGRFSSAFATAAAEIDEMAQRMIAGPGYAHAGSPGTARAARRYRDGALDPSRFVVVGESLAAGAADFQWSAAAQQRSFPAVMAQRMAVPFRQPLMQPPGPADFPGFPKLPVRIPGTTQTTLLANSSVNKAPFSNLSIPNLTLEGALCRRPSPPLVSSDDPCKQLAMWCWGWTLLFGAKSVSFRAWKLP